MLSLLLYVLIMNIITSNVRGLNSPIRCSLLYRYLLTLRHYNLVVCLQETKLSGFLLDVLTKSFASHFNYSFSPTDGTGGGLVTLISRDWKLVMAWLLLFPEIGSWLPTFPFLAIVLTSAPFLNAFCFSIFLTFMLRTLL
ncbi:hypothetical protein O6H91_05G122600 [Diphasiastrum complanatum]|uniref:Uncharacterized protein n=1 Tax=Diphasiastrum complanatum TaxID=34168 RepID=A0ACC2DTM9_DIPCM|nr:hypothetical protein O6H91_05G122600 [Diphasiastrum complanatum]